MVQAADRRPLLKAALLAAALSLVGCGAEDAEPDAKSATPAEAAALHPVLLRPVPGAPRVHVVRPEGGVEAVACATCHAVKAPAADQRGGPSLDAFHRGLEMAHGALTCLSCHDATDYDRLRLADGRPLRFEDVMQLCSQCHGPQARDHAAGLHGGMSGYWDRTRGPQVRNQCTHCHAPHAPAFPRMQPGFKPIDRFLAPVEEGHDE